MGVAAKLIGLVVVALGCGPALQELPPLPSKGGPVWVEETTEHFILWTDGGMERGRDLVRDMELRRKIVLGAAMDNADPPGKIFVIALRDADEVHTFVPMVFRAEAWSRSNPLWQPVIVIAADVSDRQVISHELTHAITGAAVREQPNWFAEGMAEYFGHASIDPGGQTVEIGTTLDLHNWEPLPVKQLLECRHCSASRFYVTAWALYAFLVNEHPDDLRRYVSRLATAHTPDAARATWDEVFPELTGLDDTLRHWLLKGHLSGVRYRLVQRDQWFVRERVLADADALVARGVLRYLRGNNAAEAYDDVAASLAADPTNLVARLLMTSIMQKIDPEAARATATAHASDWRAWWLVWFATKQGPEAQAAHDKLCKLAPEQSELCLADSMPRLPD